MTPVCPFGKASSRPEDTSCKRFSENQNIHQEINGKKDAAISPKCPFGYDTQTFKLGPLSCMICQALLFECSKCVPCSHVFCKVCVSRFKDCPLCGADIEKIEDDLNLQSVVDRFIEGHGRIKRPNVDADKDEIGGKKTIIYEDVSLDRGAFLMQQAMRALRANNIESAKSRLSVCAQDVREQLDSTGNTDTPELCSQLGAVLGMLGDCCRTTGDSVSTISYFEESVNFLIEVPKDDLGITHTLSVSLNKIGDLKYYEGDLQAARSYYSQALEVRRSAMSHHSGVPSHVIDVAVSVAKVADADRNLGNEETAVDMHILGMKVKRLLKKLRIKATNNNREYRILGLNDLLCKNQTKLQMAGVQAGCSLRFC